ncbi:uncharacterized protein LOC143568484 [Bidens hawaiensis]|uniref:uncharacterized protein LOC143568484 n=1 Tax=Bidens hawaiensis TaxID=980011 RepID=UPI00404A920C
MGNNYVMKWSKWVPEKCNIHDLLRERWNEAILKVSDNICALCEVEGESADHITTGCGDAALVWEHISRWWKVPPIYGFSVRDLLELHKSIKFGDVEKHVLHGIIVIACWSIWKAINDKVFEGIEVIVEDIIGDIKSLGFFWFKNMSK